MYLLLYYLELNKRIFNIKIKGYPECQKLTSYPYKNFRYPFKIFMHSHIKNNKKKCACRLIVSIWMINPQLTHYIGFDILPHMGTSSDHFQLRISLYVMYRIWTISLLIDMPKGQKEEWISAKIEKLHIFEIIRRERNILTREKTVIF